MPEDRQNDSRMGNLIPAVLGSLHPAVTARGSHKPETPVQSRSPPPSPDARRGRCHIVICLGTGAVWQQRRRVGVPADSESTMRPRQAKGSKKLWSLAKRGETGLIPGRVLRRPDRPTIGYCAMLGPADMAEQADALRSGRSEGNLVRVQLSLSAPTQVWRNGRRTTLRTWRV